MGLLFFSFWFAPKCESPLRTVSTWVLLIYSFWFAPKCESVADCIHMGLLIYSFGLLPCVRVRCGLYPHGLTDLLFLVCSQV